MSFPYTPAPQPEQPGIYTPVEGRPSYDGDTISVVLPALGDCRIRLAGVDTPELGEPGGIEARDFVNGRMRAGQDIWCWLQLAKDRDGDDRVSLREFLRQASFDRWPGTVYVDGVDLRVELIGLKFAEVRNGRR